MSVIFIVTRFSSLQWRHNGCDDVSNCRRLECLFNRWFRRRSKKTSKLCVTGVCEGNSPVTGEFPAQRVSDAGSVSIWWRHHVFDVSPWCRLMLVSHSPVRAHRTIKLSCSQMQTSYTVYVTYTHILPVLALSDYHFDYRVVEVWLRHFPQQLLDQL